MFSVRGPDLTGNRLVDEEEVSISARRHVTAMRARGGSTVGI